MVRLTTICARALAAVGLLLCVLFAGPVTADVSSRMAWQSMTLEHPVVIGVDAHVVTLAAFVFDDSAGLSPPALAPTARDLDLSYTAASDAVHRQYQRTVEVALKPPIGAGSGGLRV